jgi:hypothetical protein
MLTVRYMNLNPRRSASNQARTVSSPTSLDRGGVDRNLWR